jgi:signal transduction histidine kinase
MTIRLTILPKGLILIAVPLFFQLAFIALVARMRADSTRAATLTIHTKDVIAQAQNCRARLLEAHGAIQGLILTRDPSFEEALKRASLLAPEALTTLTAMVGDNEPQIESTSRIRERAGAFLAYMSEGQGLVRDGRMTAALAADRRRHSQILLDALERDFDAFSEVDKDLDVRRQEMLTDSWATLDRLLVGGIATSVLFTVALSVVFSRNISGRIANLTENARRVAEGKVLTPPIDGGDEIAQLDRDFHEMARTVAEAADRERVHAELLKRRAEELDLVVGQLREKAQENEMFVYSVSHDLRSPLVNLQGFSKELELIGRDLGKAIDQDGVPAEVRRKARALIGTEMAESIGFIQTAVTRLSGIIDALLRLSRAGRVEYRQQAVEVAPIVKRVVAALRGTMEERSATILVGDLPPAQGDPTAIEQVFANLIGNALNYLDRERPGRIEVFAAGPDGTVEGLDPGLIVYAVKDNGLGIDDSYRSKVFTIFQRLHGDVAKGEGVGLALVRRMVERHGGRVWFESEPGVGTTFFVALPGAECETGEAAEGPDEGPSAVSATTENGSDDSWRQSR